MQKKSEKIILTLYLLGFLALALTIALLQPLANTPPLFGNPPDEHARYLIPQFICRYGRIPTGLEEEVRIPAYGFSYALYNVFPYIVQGYIMRFVSLFTESEIALLYTARLVNVTFGLLMAVVVYFIGKRVFQDDRFRWLFCFAVTYLPLYYISSIYPLSFHAKKQYHMSLLRCHITADQEKISAEVSDGVLKIEIPKISHSSSKSIKLACYLRKSSPNTSQIFCR